MANKFTYYYSLVQEHADDMVHEIYNELLDELKESYGYSYKTWERLNESFLSEYNYHIQISLREAVDIIEQSKRLISDEAFYIEAGDCREQIKAMGYWTYRSDLMAEFKIALKNKLKEDIPEFESKVTQLESEIKILEEKAVNIETLIQDFVNVLSDNENTEKIEKAIELNKQILEQYEVQLEKFNDELEQATDLVENVESFISEL